jgi:nucleotide-binding universal stress UspA family protein
MFRRLLVPLDGSGLAEVVLPLVESLAPAFGASVTLLHVLEQGASPTVHGEPHLTRPDDADRYLERVATQLRARGIAVTTHTHEVPQGDVARSIVEHAGEDVTDLIVLCTHGRGSVRTRLFGSIAQQVIHRGTTPVVLTRPSDEGSDGPFAPRMVLVALDATAAAECALAPARELAIALGAALRLVMVVATQATQRGDAAPAATLLPSASQALLDLQQQDAQRYLDDLAGALRGPGLSVTTAVRRGSPAATLAVEAAESEAGLVVVATHGRVGLQAIWVGSVTADLLARVRMPVLLLRIPEGKEDAP